MLSLFNQAENDLIKRKAALGVLPPNCLFQEVDIMTGYRTRSMMCHPILDGQGEVIGVAQVINKGRRHEGHPGLILEQQNNGSTEADAFGPGDEAVVEKYLPFCGIGK